MLFIKKLNFCIIRAESIINDAYFFMVLENIMNNGGFTLLL